MKNIIIVLLSVFTFTFSFAQEKVANFGENSETYATNRSNGVYVFHLNSSEYTEKFIAEKANYYTNHFNVTTSVEGDLIKVQVTLKGISQENKNIVTRLFVSLDVKEIKYKGESFETREFLSKYI
ncbi:MAG: hypothetical protein KDC84_05265 [Crocinitomicaceae bacterium]|nr:hypothetical protein [Crocinitomicaceae bacterium]